MEVSAPVVEARGLAVHTRRGPVFGPLDLMVAPGECVVVTAPAGSGKTALLLTLGGRMRPSAGSLRVAGLDARTHAGAIRRRCGLAVFPGLNELAGPLTVRDTLASELYLSGGRGDRTAAIAGSVGLAGHLDLKVEDLSEPQRCALGIGTALVGDPVLILIDEFGAGLTRAERSALARIVRDVTARGTAVVASCVDADAALGADRIVRISVTDGSGVSHAVA